MTTYFIFCRLNDNFLHVKRSSTYFHAYKSIFKTFYVTKAQANDDNLLHGMLMHRELEQMEPRLNFQVPSEGLKLVILLNKLWSLGHHKSVLCIDGHPIFFSFSFYLLFQNLFTERILNFLLLRNFIIFLKKTL